MSEGMAFVDSPALFDLEPPEGIAGDTTPLAEALDPVDDNTAWTSCRHCRTLTTAAGITSRGHDDPGGRACARMLAWQEAS